jgi:predicted nucleotidyltransferase
MINFQAALKAFIEKRVNFVVVGGYAATLYGSGYLTSDLDICYDRTSENIERLVAALKPYHPHLRGAPPDLPFIFDVKTVSQGMNFTLQTDIGDLDLLGHMDGIGQFPEVARDAVSISTYGMECRVVSLDALIRSKRAACRAKDLNLLPELEALKEEMNLTPPAEHSEKE